MATLSRHERLEKAHMRSYKNLRRAQQSLVAKSGYNSTETRQSIRYLFSQEFGRDPYEWQLDVTESIILGLDTVLIAGTGAGKTMPFMMPLMVKKNKLEIIVSPLKVLQKDQVCSDTLKSPSELTLCSIGLAFQENEDSSSSCQWGYMEFSYAQGT